MSNQDSIKTRTVRAALETDTQHGAVVPPIHLTSTSPSAATAKSANTTTHARAIQRATRSGVRWRTLKAALAQS